MGLDFFENFEFVSYVVQIFEERDLPGYEKKVITGQQWFKIQTKKFHYLMSMYNLSSRGMHL